MTVRSSAARALLVGLAAGVALTACGGSSTKSGRSASTTTDNATPITGTSVASTAASTVEPAATAARPSIDAATAAALLRQSHAADGQLAVANSAIAQADVDAAEQQEGTAP